MGDFNIIEDVDRLYFPRRVSGRCLQSVLKSHGEQIATPKRYQQQKEESVNDLVGVCDHESNNIIRVANEVGAR